MLLQKLEVRGFKSFGDKTVIHFNEGVTGIVGPNGCGKSNVIDAIRWVLGEQSTKNLRSDKMENVIFNGTKNRKPLQMAEVSLTFLNNKHILPTEYSEVTVTRRYYRTGEGEYLLNGVPCRLKDINNLFLDTGIGSDSYAIIELKMVDSILNDTNHERRNLFEEAAGISKFKVRKKETFKKLADTDADLERVEDLLFEIRKNLKTLERQAKQAQQYFQTKELYKQNSLELARKTVGAQGEIFEKLNAKLFQENDLKLQLQNQIEKQIIEIEDIKKKANQAEQAWTLRQKAFQNLMEQIRQIEADRRIKDERNFLLDEKKKNLEKQIDFEQEREQGIGQNLADLVEKTRIAEETLAEIADKLRNWELDKNKAQEENRYLQQESENARQKLNLKQQEVAQWRKNQEMRQLQYNSQKQELERYLAEMQTQQAQSGRLEDEKLDLQDQIADKETEIQELEQNEQVLAHQITVEQTEIEALRDEMNQMQRILDTWQHEYKLTHSMVESLEGFPEAVKFLKKNPNWLQNVPLVSDLITCEERYRTAIEYYLNPYMDYYVVQTEAEAQMAVSLLEKNKKGKANFFIMSELQNFYFHKSEVIDQAISALDLIEVEPAYRKLAEYLLGEVYLVNNLV